MSAVVAFPRPAPDNLVSIRDQRWQKEDLPPNAVPLRSPPEPYEPQPVAMTMERAALRAIFAALKPKQKRAVLGSLWRAHLAGGDDDWLKFYVARAMLRGEKV